MRNCATPGAASVVYSLSQLASAYHQQLIRSVANKNSDIECSCSIEIGVCSVMSADQFPQFKLPHRLGSTLQSHAQTYLDCRIVPRLWVCVIVIMR